MSDINSFYGEDSKSSNDNDKATDDGIRVIAPVTAVQDRGWGSYSDEGFQETRVETVSKSCYDKVKAKQLVFSTRYDSYLNGFFFHRDSEKGEKVFAINHTELSSEILKLLSLEHIAKHVGKDAENSLEELYNTFKSYLNSEKGENLLSLVEQYAGKYQDKFSLEEARNALNSFDLDSIISVLSPTKVITLEFSLRDLSLDIMLYVAIFTQLTFLKADC